jgi:hypothetical protein
MRRLRSILPGLLKNQFNKPGKMLRKCRMTRSLLYDKCL